MSPLQYAQPPAGADAAGVFGRDLGEVGERGREERGRERLEEDT